MIIKHLPILATLFLFGKTVAQNGPTLSGNIEANGNFFVRDTLIGASNTPQYERQLFGAETWLTLNYAYKGFDGGLRFDLFNNSNLPNPTDSYTAQGIGRWWIHKKVNKLDIAVGYLYDQIGVGTIFRAYEARPLNIDNALYGVRLGYQLAENWKVKAFTGKQKNQFDAYASIIKGAAVDGYYQIDSARNISIAPGFGLVNRTLDDQSVGDVVAAISTYTPRDSIGACSNTWAGSFYNTLTIGNFSWYVEVAQKTRDVLFDANAPKLNWNGSTSLGKLINRSGSIYYTNFTWTNKQFGFTVEGKRTEHFAFRTNPFVSGTRGAINFLPPIAKQNTYRLTARYQPSTQELGEQGVQADLRYSPHHHLQFAVNLSAINNLDGGALYREMYSEVTYKQGKKWQLIGGLQLQYYNQTVYENHLDTIHTITPYAEFLYKFSRKKSIRVEAQYMHTKDDFGSWLFGLAEFGLAPHWIFTTSDMFKLKKQKGDNASYEKRKLDGQHFFTAGVVYVRDASRFSLDWVKQVEGIVCSGGICRYEPAFNGVRLKVSSNF